MLFYDYVIIPGFSTPDDKDLLISSSTYAHISWPLSTPIYASATASAQWGSSFAASSEKGYTPESPPNYPSHFESVTDSMGVSPGSGLWRHAVGCSYHVFFGFLRSGEITTPSLSGYDPQSHLSWGDVAIDKFASPSCVRVHLRRSKCDPFGQGVDVYFGRTDNVVCPVRALLTYVVSRGNHAGPFLVHPDSTPLTKTHFTDAVRLALQHAGLEPGDYAGHSFRIGAATTAASAGMEDSLIQTLGRWCSAAFVSYIRTPPTQLAAVSSTLARISALPLQQ